ncbi:MAG: hypothetical protein U5N53_22490 [Mycobacterium sp.]|nr:hypothetical protein [Mycobacterium sp.]
MNHTRDDRSTTLPCTYTSLVAYNCAYPDAGFPAHPSDRAKMRRFDAAGLGVQDDVIERGLQMSIDFLPGGVPPVGEPDHAGSVVASVWGSGPIYVLAEQVLLRAAWLTISAQWPTTLSGVRSALNDVRWYGPPSNTYG